MKEERAIKRKKRRIKFVVKLGVFLLIAGAVVFLLKSPFFNVKNFRVEGNSYYTDEEILVMGNCKTGGNIFIGIDTGDIRSRLEKDAYMSSVKVKRVLPDTVKIQLEERKQTAAIVYGEKYVVVDGDGVVLRKTGVMPEITVLKGLTISKLSVGEKVETEEKVLLRQTLQMLSVMEKSNMYFKTIELSEGEIKAHILDNLICQGTPENIMKAMEKDSLQLVVQELFDRKIERGTIKISGDRTVSFTPKID
ncbi:MAG: FtsQ-type POTRA domain-containing protein [Firmicutes bacterium]|nr:FtsQ-type POTRA domain-containing protein [Bacillota bacterium]